MTDYIHITVKKRDLRIKVKMPERGDDAVTIENPILWDDMTDILWDDNTDIIWDTGTTAYAMVIPARKRSFVINTEVNNG